MVLERYCSPMELGRRSQLMASLWLSLSDRWKEYITVVLERYCSPMELGRRSWRTTSL